MSKTNVLLLIDGLNVVRRIYEAIPLEDSLEKAEKAIRSSVSSIRRAIVEVQPTHGLCVFDFGGSTFRHAMHPEYKAARKPMPSELRDQLEAIKEGLLVSLGLESVAIAGVEAEDVIAAITRKARMVSDDIQVVILSTDKDLCALVDDGVRLRDNFQSEYRDADWVFQKYHVYPSQMVDCLALTGDNVDGVPGVPGIGYKTAAGLLQEFGSLAELLSRANEIPGKKGESIRAHRDTIQLAKALVQLKDDIAVGMHFSDMKLPKLATYY